MTDDERVISAGTILAAMLEEQGFTPEEGLVVFDVALRLGRFAHEPAEVMLAARKAEAIYKRTGFG